MKRFLSILCLLAFFSCTEDDNPNPNASPQELSSTLVSGEWVVDLFIDDGVNETSMFNGFSFNFLDNGRVEAISNGQVIETGNWSTYQDDGKVGLDISFSSDARLDELSDDWYKMNFSNNRIDLEEDYDEDESDEDRLRFVRR